MLTIKSSRSRIVLPAPSGWNPLNRLNPNTHGSESRIITTRFTATALPLEHPVRSIANEMIFSNTAIIVDAAAKSIQRKKILPQILSSCHRIKYIRQCDKIKILTAVRVDSESKTCRENNKSREQRYTCIKNGYAYCFSCQTSGAVDVASENARSRRFQGSM